MEQKNKILLVGGIAGIVFGAFAILLAFVSMIALEAEGADIAVCVLFIVLGIGIASLGGLMCNEKYRTNKQIIIWHLVLTALTYIPAIIFFAVDYMRDELEIIFVVFGMVFATANLVILSICLTQKEVKSGEEYSGTSDIQAWQIVLAIVFFPVGLLFLLIKPQAPQITIQNNIPQRTTENKIEVLKALRAEGEITEEEYKQLLMKELEK
ncbi:MAG: SHOCT domain-containing protein [Firmicutes bacterium]|nr:SHOCT domain-containing protein [Bacillota bacterium]